MDNEKIVCSKCGNEISKDDKFCSHCGSKNEGYEKENITFVLIDWIFIVLSQLIIILNIAFRGSYYYIYRLYYIELFVHIILGVIDIILNKNKNRRILMFVSLLLLLIASIFFKFIM